MKLLAEDIKDVFGQITPPAGIGAGSDPKADLSYFLGGSIRIFIIVCSLAMLIYMLWGALDWITSGGEKEKISKAQNKITNAVIGFIVLFAVFAIFNLIMNNVLHLNIINFGT